MMLRLANYSMLEGKYDDAVKKFVEVLKLFDSTLVPPYKSYYDCVQNLRRCMLSLGNYSIVWFYYFVNKINVFNIKMLLDITNSGVLF